MSKQGSGGIPLPIPTDPPPELLALLRGAHLEMTIPKAQWSKAIIYWRDNGKVLVSVPFTWQLSEARLLCRAFSDAGHEVFAGGPAVKLLPDFLKDVAKCNSIELDALPRHNPQATFTSRGCPRHCPFCAVPKIEGDLTELQDWTPKPVVCDNNLLACSQRHFDTVVDRLKGLKGIDFNQGLDARLLTQHHVDRLRELDITVLRFAWDETKLEAKVMTAIEQCLKVGFPRRKLRIYVLIGFNDMPEDALYRLQTMKDMGIWPNVQRFQPLDALKKNSFVAPGWTDLELRRMARYWNRQRWLEHVAYQDYDPRVKEVMV